MEKMMDPNIIDYYIYYIYYIDYIINCAIPSIITIENRSQIEFGKPDGVADKSNYMLLKMELTNLPGNPKRV